MSFINRLLNRPVVLDLYTSHPHVMEFSPPVKTAKVFPEWWRNLPKQTSKNVELRASNNMKGCVGFTDLYQTGIVVPMWSDLRCEVGASGSTFAQWEFADPKSSLTVHSAVQRGEYLPEDRYQHLKLISPWLAKCSEDVRWLLVQPTWNFEQPDKIVIPPGIVEFKYQPTTNVNLFVPRAENAETIAIAQGQPLIQFIPLTERCVVYRTHLVTQEKMEELRAPQSWFMGVYKKSKKIRQSCPMGGVAR